MNNFRTTREQIIRAVHARDYRTMEQIIDTLSSIKPGSVRRTVWDLTHRAFLLKEGDKYKASQAALVHFNIAPTEKMEMPTAETRVRHFKPWTGKHTPTPKIIRADAQPLREMSFITLGGGA